MFCDLGRPLQQRQQEYHKAKARIFSVDMPERGSTSLSGGHSSTSESPGNRCGLPWIACKRGRIATLPVPRAIGIPFLKIWRQKWYTSEAFIAGTNMTKQSSPCERCQ